MIPRFMYPEALLLGIPALGLVWVLHSRGRAGLRGLRGRIALTIRSAIVILLLLALAGLQMVEERRFATVIFAVDCSRSVPEALQKRSLEYIRGALKTKMPDDRAGLIAFGGHASVERWPDESFVTTPETIRGQIRKDATDISEALRAAAAAFPSAGGKRVVLFTDGRETRGDAAAEAQRLRAAGIRIDVVPLDSGWTREVLVEKLAMPAEVGFDEAFDADVHVRSTGPCDAVVRLFSDERMEPPERDSAGRLAPEAADGRGTDAGGEEGGKHRPAKTMLLERRVRLLEGRNRIPFPGLRIRRGGFHRFEATVETLDPGADSIRENNHAYGFTHVETDCRALIMTSDIGMIEPLYAALEGERLELDVRTPINLPTSPAEIADYDCIVLANIGRGHFSGPMMEEIEVCVRDRGAGLIMIGGDQSFGAGGYLNTPVESALPVKMDIENRKLMPNGALALVIDRSGSMEGDKLALAKAAARAAADTLSDEDYIAVLAFDAEVYWLVRPIRAQHRGKIRAAISSLGAGGGTFIYPALKEAWYALKPLDAATKHIILLSDGQTMGNGYEKLARAIAADRITVTSVGIGEPDGQPLMQSIARNGGGRYYEAKDPRKLPQIFIKEAAIVRKPLILSDEKGLPVQPHQPGELARGMASPIPPVRAIVMTTPKPAAEIELVVTAGGEKLPLLAAWHFGLGRAVAFTSDASARWAPAWVSWEGYKGFWIRTFRWAGRKRIPGEHTVTCRAEGEIARVTIEGIDRKGEYINFARLAGAATGPSREPVPLRFEQKAPGRYEAIFALDEVGAYSVTVVDERPGGIAHSQTVGISNSYSPEYLHLDADRPLIARLASSDPAAGRMLSLDDDPGKAGIFARDFPPSREPTDMFWLLLWAALLLFPLDVAVRRIFFEPEPAIARSVARLRIAISGIRRAAMALAGRPAGAARPDMMAGTGGAGADRTDAGTSAAVEGADAGAAGATAAAGMPATPAAAGRRGAPVAEGAAVKNERLREYEIAGSDAKPEDQPSSGPQPLEGRPQTLQETRPKPQAASTEYLDRLLKAKKGASKRRPE